MDSYIPFSSCRQKTYCYNYQLLLSNMCGADGQLEAGCIIETQREMSSPRHGGELQAIKQPEKVKVLILSESRASFKDFYLIATFTRLIKIDLSYNKLTAFPPGFSFRTFTQLRTLFLHYNKFSAIKQLLPVTESSSVHYLTLFGNPLQEAKARHFFVNEISTLLLMDDKPVRLDERNPDFSLGDRPIPLLTFPLASLATEESQSKMYIQVLIRELVIARKAYLRANPVVLIQRWWRHCLRKAQRKWKNNQTKPPEEIEPMARQSSLKHYKASLQEMQAQEQSVKKSKPKSQQIVFAVLNGNYHFWKTIDEMVDSGRVLLSRQYCMLRGIHFQEADMLVLRRPRNITAVRKRLSLLQWWHHQMIILNRKKTNKKPIVKDISLKASEEYKINRNRFLHYQQKLIKKEQEYRHFVLPQFTPTQLKAIIRKEFWRAMRNLLSGRNYEFPFLLEGLSMRQKAAVSIQRIWRGCKVRKSVDAYLKIKEKESAIRIQRWVRKLPFIHRRKFLLQVTQYLKGQKNSQITLEVGQLEAIQAYGIYKQKYSCNFAIPFQTSSFSISVAPPHSIVFHAPRKPYPAYLGLSFRAEQRQGNAFVRSSVLDILFKGVRQVSRITDSKGTRFVKLGYDSIEQALNRKFILALKTYRMIKHQFIRSREAPNVPPQYCLDFIAEINQVRMVSITYDASEKHEASIDTASRKLQVSRSQGSELALVNNTLSLRLKYYVGKTDLSCTINIRETAYRCEERHPMQLQMKQFYLPRRSSHRYDDDYGPEITSKISRNILSLEELQYTHTHRRETVPYTKILSTDQSHTMLDGGQEQGRSVNRLMSYRKSESYDRFDKQVYPPPMHGRNSQPWPSQSVNEKRQRIEQIKAAHKKNIESISLQKTENLTQLRQSVRKESENRVRMIDDARSILEQERTRQHNKVRDHFKSATSNFEQEFLKKGIGSIRKGMRDFEKKRPQGQPAASPPQLHSMKTEIKELSLTFDPEQPSRQVLKQSVLTYDLKEPTLKSQPSELAKEEEDEEPPAETSHAIPKKEKQDAQRKKLRKKRLVHSVFPQEFYPIKQSNQIGFELPRITKK